MLKNKYLWIAYHVPNIVGAKDIAPQGAYILLSKRQ